MSMMAQARQRSRRHRMVLLGVGVLSITLVAALLAFNSQDNQSTSALLEDLRESRLEAAVRVALLEKLKVDGLRIEIEVRGDEITLGGRVKERSSQELAKEVALGITGVRAVNNRIKLAPDSDRDTPPIAGAVAHAEREVADGLLEGRVKLRLLDELGTNAFSLEVEATDGVVSVRGTVSSEDQRRIALEVVRSTHGVERAIDLIKVK